MGFIMGFMTDLHGLEDMFTYFTLKGEEEEKKLLGC